MSLRVTRTGDDSYPLRFFINGIEEQVFELYQSTRDACIENGYSTYLLSWESWIIKFYPLDDGQIWTLDVEFRNYMLQYSNTNHCRENC